jgi:hypothetical protein
MLDEVSIFIWRVLSRAFKVRDDSQEDFVVDDGVEDSSTVSLIQLEEEGPWARRDI